MPQENLDFLQSQMVHYEPGVYMKQYPFVQYRRLVPVSTEADEWSQTIVHYTSDGVGEVAWQASQAVDVPLVDINRGQFAVKVTMAAIGYRWDHEELVAAERIGYNLNGDKASFCRERVEKFIDNIVLYGDTDRGWDGLINNSVLTRTEAGQGTNETFTVAADRYWSNRDEDAVMEEINALLTGVYVDSLQVEMADTLIMPISASTMLATRRISDTSISMMTYLRENNVYTMETGQPLRIITCRGIENAATVGTGTANVEANSGRVLAYRMDNDVLKLHYPMPHMFMPAREVSDFVYQINSYFRLGGLEIRRPGAMRYLDGVSP